MGCSRNQALGGALLVVAYTGLIASADGITKLLAGQYAAAQLYALSGAMVAGFCLLADRLPAQRGGFRTACPRAMALRSVATLIAAVCFFYAFRLLPFAEVFVFIGLMPLLAGPEDTLSEAVLQELRIFGRVLAMALDLPESEAPDLHGPEKS